jgi:hypothetical protein
LLQLAAAAGIVTFAVGRRARHDDPPGGRRVLDLDPLLDANITFHGVLIQDDGEPTRALAQLLAGGALQAVVSHVLPLAAAEQAHGSWKAAMPTARSSSMSRAADLAGT